MLETWTDGVFDTEVNNIGRIACAGTQWEVGSIATRGLNFWSVFRALENPRSYFLLATRNWNQTLEVLPEPATSPNPNSLAVWGESLKLGLELRAWGRALWFDDNLHPATCVQEAKWRAFVLPDGRSTWGRVPDGTFAFNFDTIYPFALDANAPSFEGATAREWTNWMSETLRHPTDCRFASRFARLSERDKIRFALRWQHGTFSEFERVCQWIGLLAIDWDKPWDGGRLTIHIGINDSDTDYAQSDSPKRFPILPDLSSAEHLWSWARSVCAPHPRPDRAHRKCIAAWTAHTWSHVEISVAPPSAHERLEALASLRDWSRKAGVESELLDHLNAALSPTSVRI